MEERVGGEEGEISEWRGVEMDGREEDGGTRASKHSPKPSSGTSQGLKKLYL